MEDFRKWGISRDVGAGNQRTVFTVVLESGNKKVLRTRQDVVIFLAKNPEIDIPIERFIFKKFDKDVVENKEAMDRREIESRENTIETENTEIILEENSGNKPQKRKLLTETGCSFQEKVSRVMEPTIVKPNQAFAEFLPKLHRIRMTHSNPNVTLSSAAVNELKTLLTDSTVSSEPIQLVKSLCKNKEISSAFHSVFFSGVESEIELNSLKDSKSVTMEFPPSNSKNFYIEVLEEAIQKMPKLLSFVVNIVDSGEKVLTPSYAIKIANLLCSVLNTKDRRHSALNKINTLHMMFNRSTVSNLKIFQNKGNCCGHTEGTRLIEELSELAEHFKASNFTLNLGCQLTMDNLDIMMNNQLQHWILVYSRQDPIQTSHLSNLKPDFQLDKIDHSVVFLKSSELDYLKLCTKKALVKKMTDLSSGFASLLKTVGLGPVHQYKEMLDKQEVYIEALEPLHEMEHTGT